jgi:hypothetical protein
LSFPQTVNVADFQTEIVGCFSRQPQLLSWFSQHGEAHCVRELLDAKAIEHARAVHFNRAHADAKLERNDFARPRWNQRDKDLTLPPAEGCDPMRSHQLLADPLM